MAARLPKELEEKLKLHDISMEIGSSAASQIRGFLDDICSDMAERLVEIAGYSKESREGRRLRRELKDTCLEGVDLILGESVLR